VRTGVVFPQTEIGNDPVLVRLAVEEAPRTIDWLEELGFPFPDDNPVIYHGHEPYRTARTYWGRELGASILEVLRPRLLDLVIDGRIDLRLGTRMVDLVVHERQVAGVAVHGPAGPRRISGTSVVLATGGLSLPKTGSDGFGYTLAREQGHTIVPTLPAPEEARLIDARTAIPPLGA